MFVVVVVWFCWSSWLASLILSPVSISKFVSVLGLYKGNSSSLLNHRLIEITFFLCQTCIQSDFTMVRLGPSINIKFRTGSETTISRSIALCPRFCATPIGENSTFAPLIHAWKKRISGEKASKIYYMGDLYLQMPSTDFYSEFGTGISHESNASFFTPLSYLLWRLSFCSYTIFFLEKYSNFWGFLSVPHLVDNYAKIVDERGRSVPYVRLQITERPALICSL